MPIERVAPVARGRSGRRAARLLSAAGSLVDSDTEHPSDDDWSVDDWVSKLRQDVRDGSRYGSLVPTTFPPSPDAQVKFPSRPMTKRPHTARAAARHRTRSRKKPDRSKQIASSATVEMIKAKRMMFALLQSYGFGPNSKSGSAQVGNDLMLIKQLFGEGNNNTRKNVTRSEFVRIWSGVFVHDGQQSTLRPHGLKNSLALLFDKIDSLSQGKISWDDYLTYLLRELSAETQWREAEGQYVLAFSEKRSSINDTLGSRRKFLQVLHYVPEAASRRAKYVSCSDNGVVTVMNAATHTIMASLDTKEAQSIKQRAKLFSTSSTSSSSPGSLTTRTSNGQLLIPANVGRVISECKYGSLRRDWVVRGLRVNNQEAQKWASKNRRDERRSSSSEAGNMSQEYYPNVNVVYNQQFDQLIVAKEQTKIIDFYSCRLNRFIHSMRLKCEYTVSTLALNGTSQANSSALLTGDSAGFLNIYRFRTGSSLCATTPATRIAAHKSGETALKVDMCANLGLLSGGMDGALVLTDPEVGKVKRRFLLHTNEVLKGVFDFDYDSNKRLIVSANYGGKLAFWDPYYIDKPVFEDASLGSPIVGIHANASKMQVITVLQSGSVLLYDVRKLSRVQEIHHTNRLEGDRLTSSCLNTRDQVLLTCGADVQTWDVINAPLNSGPPVTRKTSVALSAGDSTAGPPRLPVDTSRVQTHDDAIFCLYAKVFHQIISVTRRGSVRVFDLFSGLPTFCFTTTHTSAVKCGALDQTGKRLLIAHQDGNVLIYNYSNGGLLATLTTNAATEITQVLYLPHAAKSIIAGTFTRGVVCWIDPKLQGSRSKHSRKATDLLCNSSKMVRTCSVATLAYSREVLSSNELLAAGTMQGEVLIYNASIGQLWRTAVVPSPKQVPFGLLNGASRVGMRPGRATEHAYEDADSCASAMLFLEGLLVVGTRSGGVFFMNIIGGEWTNSIMCNCGEDGKLALTGEIAGLAGIYEHTLRSARVTPSLPGSRMLLLVNTVIKNESTLHLLSLNRTLTANVMVVNVLRKWVPHAHSSVVDCVFINAHQEAQVFMTCSSDGAICLWDLRGDLVDTFRSNTSSSDILWPLQRSAELRVLKLSTLTGVASRVETDPRVLSTSTSPSSSLVSLASARRIPMAVKTDHKARTTRPRMNMHFKYSKAMLQRIEMHHKTQQKHEQLHLYHELNALDAKMAKSRKS